MLHTQGGAKLKAQGDQPSAGARIDVTTIADAQAVAERRRVSLESRKLDKCPVCASKHTYEQTWTNVQPPIKAKLLSTHLTTCPKFVAMAPDAKLAVMLANAACPQCAAWDHTEHKYAGGRTLKEPKCSVVVNSVACGGAHGRWFHEGTGTGSTNSVVATASTQGPGLYEVYYVPVHAATETSGEKCQPSMVMIDPGSDTNFITHSLAAKLGLQGQPYQFRLNVVDREARPIQTARYQFKVEDRLGSRHAIQAMGLESITTLPSDPDLSPIHHLVERYPREVLDQPQGEVDILLGLRNSALHGTTREQWGDLRLMESPLGCGWSLRGTHLALRHAGPKLSPSLSATAYTMRHAEEDPETLQVFHVRQEQEFHELDELGTAPPPVCMKCKGCRECTFRRRRLTPQEQEVMTRVEPSRHLPSYMRINCLGTLERGRGPCQFSWHGPAP